LLGARNSAALNPGKYEKIVTDDNTVHPVDQALYDSRSPRVAACGIRYGHGFCNVLWIKASDNGWVLLPHGMPNLAVHLPIDELVTMLDGLRAKL
jgi:hypothetical protein